MSNTNHVRHTSTSGDDLGSTDEVKIFEDEGDREDEKISSENLLEEKSSLIDLTESEEKSSKITTRSDHNQVLNKIEPHASNFNVGYLVSPCSYSNGTSGNPSNTINIQSLFCHTTEHLTIPPPAHCRIPPFQLDTKQIGLTRPVMYPFSSNQYPYPMLTADISQVSSWRGPSMYSSTSSFRSPYYASIPISSNLSSDFPFRFTPSILPPVDISPYNIFNTHQNIISTSSKQDSSASQRYLPNSKSFKDYTPEKKKMHIKKPLNAFMLYMKEMRAKVVAECKLKESAAINQILGRRWHELSREEQSKYYEKARQERQIHMELYPGYVLKNKKRKKDKCSPDSAVDNVKKC